MLIDKYVICPAPIHDTSKMKRPDKLQPLPENNFSLSGDVGERDGKVMSRNGIERSGYFL